MKNRYKYYLVLVSFFSFIYLSEINYEMRNIRGSSNVSLVSSNIYETTLEISVDDFLLIPIENNKYKVFIDNGKSIIELGSPDLPKLTTSIIIPDNAKMGIDVLNSEFIEYENVVIAPSKGNITRDVDPRSMPYVYNDTYKNNAFYPGKIAELDTPFILRDNRGQSVKIYPIQYNPVTKVLRVYSRINISINSKSNDGINSLSRNSSFINSNSEYENIYNDFFINSSRDTRFEYIEDEGGMLIICYDDFIDEMAPFVEWKNKKGIPTEIVGINSIGFSASAMQDYINDYYYENNLTYLLLVGDINQMPTHIVNGAASDPSFGFIEGDDSYAEVIVGRFSANNPSQLQTQIDRTLAYEMNPTFVDHLDKALGIGSNQGPGYGGLSDDDFNDLLWNDFLSNYTYDNYQGIYDPSGTVSDGINAINSGVGVINYTGHAGPTGWGNGAPLGVNDVNNLTNTNKLPFIFTVGCNPGEFNNYDCFCEAWLWATDSNGDPTGAVGHLGSTISQSWEPPMHGQWAMNAILTESYEGNISRSYGGISVNGCMHMNEAQGSYGINETNHWTIFGDPSLLIRTDEPTAINAIHDQNILVGQTEFVVDVGIDGALVALSSENELLTHAHSLGGVAVLDLSNITAEPGVVLDLVITSFNTLPYEANINVITPDGAYLVYSNYALANNPSADPFIQYGNFVEINLLVENVGTMNTNAINLTLSTDDEYITIIDDESLIAYAIAGTIAETENPFSFSVSNNVPDEHLAFFEVNLDDGDSQWSLVFNIEIHAPIFEILNPEITDDNMDGVWDPGEMATINVDLVNSGSAGFGYYPGAVISTESPYVTIISGENDNTFYGIGSNESYEGQFFIQSDPLTPMGTVVTLDISWGYSPTAPCDNDYFQGEGCVEQANLVYTTIIGHPSILVWDPSDNHTSGQRLIDYFNEIGFSGYDYIETTDSPSVENYSTAFIFLGIYPNNHQLGEEDVIGFINLLNNGGNVYLEGNDTWAFDMQTSLQPLFGLTGLADGTSDLVDIVGSEGSFAEGYSFAYVGENAYIDRLAPAGGFALLENPSADYVTAVAYDNEDFGYRTIGASHELGGLQGDNFNDYLNGILNFFDQGSDTEPDPGDCIMGDLNNDEIVNVIDVIRTVNIILGLESPPSDVELCSADLDGDNEISILDVLILINIILDERSKVRNDVLKSDSIDLLIYKNKLEYYSDFPVKGLQFTIKSNESTISINKDINMDVSSNKIGNLHHFLIYSLSGNSLDPGTINLFNTKKEFEVLEFLACNNALRFIDVEFSESILPSTFELKQNYPNPFNPSTNIDIEIGTAEHIQLTIYDIKGREVITLNNGFLNIGNHTFKWDGRDKYGQAVSSGVYIYTLRGSTSIKTNKMLMIK